MRPNTGASGSAPASRISPRSRAVAGALRPLPVPPGSFPLYRQPARCRLPIAPRPPREGGGFGASESDVGLDPDDGPGLGRRACGQFPAIPTLPAAAPGQPEHLPNPGQGIGHHRVAGKVVGLLHPCGSAEKGDAARASSIVAVDWLAAA